MTKTWHVDLRCHENYCINHRRGGVGMFSSHNQIRINFLFPTNKNIHFNFKRPCEIQNIVTTLFEYYYNKIRCLQKDV